MRLLTMIADRIADLFGIAAKLTIIALIGSMLYEVVARYGFNAPTLWAFDISYMLNGSIFLLGSAYALKADAHVRIDFLSQMLPVRVQQWLNASVYLLVMLPLTGALAYVATGKAWRAFLSGEVESVSPWAPYVWPFYSVLAIGLAILALQFMAEGAKYLLGWIQPGAHAGEVDSESLSS